MVSPTSALKGVPKALAEVAARQLTLKCFHDLPLPTVRQVFDAVRAWGPVEPITLVRMGRYWTCRIQFYYEDDAQRFELGFPKAGFNHWDV